MYKIPFFGAIMYHMGQKSNIKSVLLKTLTVAITIFIIAFVAFYLFNLLGGESKLMEEFQLWTKENLVLACFLYLILTPLINIIPGISSIFFITLANMMLNDKTVQGMWNSFFLADGGVILSSIFLFTLGKTVGKKLLRWVSGNKEYKEAEKIITYGGKAAIPFVYLFPLFPDDTICFIAGCTNMSFLYNIINVLIFRSVGVFVTCFFGTDFFDYKNFTWWQWLIFISCAIIAALLIFFISRAYYRYLRKKEEGNIYPLTRGLKTKINKMQKEKEKEEKELPLNVSETTKDQSS